MADREHSIPDNKDTPPKAIPVLEQAKGVQKGLEKKDTKSQKTDIEIKKETPEKESKKSDSTPEQSKRMKDREEMDFKYQKQKELLEAKRDASTMGENLAGVFPFVRGTLESNKPLIDISIQDAEKKFSDSFRLRHNAIIAEKIGEKNLADISPEARDDAYRTMFIGKIDSQNLPDKAKKIEEAKKYLLEKEKEFQKLPPAEQEKKILERVVEQQTDVLVREIEVFKKLSPEEQKKPENLKKLQDVAGEKTNLLEVLQDEKVKEQIIKSIQEKGMVESGIDPQSEIGKKLIELYGRNIHEYFDPSGVSIDNDITKISDVVPGAYMDILVMPSFDIQNNPALNKSLQEARDAFKTRNFVQEVRREDYHSPEAYYDAMSAVAKEKTGLSLDIIQKKAQNTRGIDFENMNPSLKRLLTFLAPFGASFCGPPQKDFWQFIMDRDGLASPGNDMRLSEASRGLSDSNRDVSYKSDVMSNIDGVSVDIGPIQGWEGTDYGTNYPGSPQSGFTIGYGYDLRFNTPTDVEKDWGGKIDKKYIDVLKSYCGKAFSFDGAKKLQNELEAVGGFKNFRSAIDTAKGPVLKEITLPKFIAQTKHIYPQIVNLQTPAQTALVSLVYNRGPALSGSGRGEMQEIQDLLKTLPNYSSRPGDFYKKLAQLFEKMNQTKSSWPRGLKRRRNEEAALIRTCSAIKTDGEVKDFIAKQGTEQGKGDMLLRPGIDTSRAQGEGIGLAGAEELSKKQESYYKKDGSGNILKGDNGEKMHNMDCMQFVNEFIRGSAGDWRVAREYQAQKYGKEDLWNVSMQAMEFVGLGGAKMRDKNGVLKRGDKNDPTTIDYYIEENIIERVRVAGGYVKHPNNENLHYYNYSYQHAGKGGPEAIVDDIVARLNNGEQAVMGATGEGTNKQGHAWMVFKENGKLRMFHSGNHGGKGLEDWKVGEVSDFVAWLNLRKVAHPSEAIIFAKKG
ncbi:MAG: hypothetical protein WC753_03550 [Candidatus Gracilibacteria bacterium]